jgi:hypothetical protein
MLFLSYDVGIWVFVVYHMNYLFCVPVVVKIKTYYAQDKNANAAREEQH